LILPADLPLIQPETHKQFLDLKGNQVAAPVVLAQFATEIIANDVGCMTDIDTVQDLLKAQQILQDQASAQP
jgi:2-phospho-L-lactate guanylyltransferase (CobY/MobA/RfbA family)